MDDENELAEMFKFLKKSIKKQGGDPSDVKQLMKQMVSLGPRCDTIPNARGEFGYDKSNPIPVCYPNGQMEYLRSLRCKCGEQFDFSRIGNLGPGPDGHVVDGFELVCKTGKCQITLYMDMHHLGPSSLVPKKLRKADG